MPEDRYPIDFPKLKLPAQRTSDPAYYNCIGFVVGDNKGWWPGEYPPWSPDYWPPKAPQETTLEAFTIALSDVQYVPCSDGSLERGFEKAALYAFASGEIRHGARQQPDGTWRSKLGLRDEDIQHTLEELVGPHYGTVVAFLKRPNPLFTQSDKPAPSSGGFWSTAKYVISILTAPKRGR